MKEKILNIYKEFFDNIGISYDNMDIIEKEENIFLINMKSDDSGLIIWQNGKNLEAINNILRLIISNKFEKKIKVYLEVNDYLHSKDENLKNFIYSKVKIVEKKWGDLKLPFYTAYERRKIHSFVSEYWNDKIYTKSIGEWKDRRLHICKKDEKLSIDIDSVDI